MLCLYSTNIALAIANTSNMASNVTPDKNFSEFSSFANYSGQIRSFKLPR